MNHRKQAQAARRRKRVAAYRARDTRSLWGYARASFLVPIIEIGSWGRASRARARAKALRGTGLR